MSSITEATAKTSDELKDEVDAALSMVGQDLTELKEDLTPKRIMDEVIIKDRFPQLRSAISYMNDRPFLLVGLGLGVGALIAFQTASKRHESTRFAG